MDRMFLVFDIVLLGVGCWIIWSVYVEVVVCCVLVVGLVVNVFILGCLLS